MAKDIEPIDADFDDVAKAMLVRGSTPSVSGPVPIAVVDGFLPLGNIEIPCAVLDDIHNTRVLTQEGFLKSIGRAGKAKGGEGRRRIDGRRDAPFSAGKEPNSLYYQ